jgi:hypothetical protein
MDPAAFQEREFALIRRETNLVGSPEPSDEVLERIAP